MNNYSIRKREPFRFSNIVNAMLAVENLDFQVSCLMLINNIVNHAPTVEERIALRRDFMLLDTVHIMHDIIDKFGSALPSAIQDVVDMFETQVEVFEDMMHRDKEELLKDDLDLQDPAPIFGRLLVDCSESNLSSYLLSILHHMILIPTEHMLGVRMWEVLQESCAEITQLSTYNALHNTILSYGKVQSLIDLKDDLDHKISSIGEKDDIISRQKEKIEQLEVQLTQVSDMEIIFLDPLLIMKKMHSK